MIGCPRGSIAVDPIFDSSVTDPKNVLSQEERDYLDSQGISYDSTTVAFRIPESAIKKCDQGIVKYVGKDVEEKYDVHIGEWVLFSGYSGTTLRLQDEGLLILMGAESVVAKIKAPTTEVPGLYFFDGENYYTATHEIAIGLIAKNFEELRLIESREVKNG